MIWNLGSINADHIYRVPHLPAAGDTLAATDLSRGLGGKGANMSVAAVRAGSPVAHIGAVGADGEWAVRRLHGYGVDVRHIQQVPMPTGHANICVDPSGENAIVLFPGANDAITDAALTTALSEAGPGDWLVLQNETSGQPAAARLAKSKGMQVLYAAAPFDVNAVQAVRPFVDLLVLNAVEAAQLEAGLKLKLEELGIPNIVVTQGAQGCLWISRDAPAQGFAAPSVQAVDTTGAGDTFTGYLVAGLDQGLDMAAALGIAGQAAAIMVTRKGTADVIPQRSELPPLHATTPPSA
jgi:ribokinase